MSVKTAGELWAQSDKLHLSDQGGAMNTGEKRSKTTIQDIARQAGVSKATVSQILNGSSRFSTKTHQKILMLAEQLHYEPSQEARRLAQRRWAPNGTDPGLLSSEQRFRLA